MTSYLEESFANYRTYTTPLTVKATKPDCYVSYKSIWKYVEIRQLRTISFYMDIARIYDVFCKG